MLETNFVEVKVTQSFVRVITVSQVGMNAQQKTGIKVQGKQIILKCHLFLVLGVNTKNVQMIAQIPEKLCAALNIKKYFL